MMSKSTDTIASLLKGLKVLECFDGQTARLSIVDVARRTGLDRATSRRCLLTLHHGGYANYDGKFFTLTPRALRLGLGALSAMPMSQVVQPWLDKLSDQIGQSCSISILDGTEIIYIARAAQKRVMSIGLMPGSRLPAHCTSMGRVLLASLTAERVRSILNESDLTPRTPRSISDPEAIMTQLAQIRLDGYSVNNQEIEMGLISLAVPLVDSKNNTVAALNTGMSASLCDPDGLVRDFLPPLMSIQAGLARIL